MTTAYVGVLVVSSTLQSSRHSCTCAGRDVRTSAKQHRLSSCSLMPGAYHRAQVVQASHQLKSHCRRFILGGRFCFVLVQTLSDHSGGAEALNLSVHTRAHLGGVTGPEYCGNDLLLGVDHLLIALSLLTRVLDLVPASSMAPIVHVA